MILGASREDQLEENLAALEVVPLLSGEVLERIEGVLDNAPPPPKRF